jgi:hypothetical protein
MTQLSILRGAGAAVLLSLVIVIAFVMPAIASASGATFPAPRRGEVNNPLSVSSIPEFLSKVFRGAVTLFTPLAVFFIVLAGFQFVAARGSSEALAKARANLMYVIIGVGLFLGAWAIAELLAATIRQLGA